MSRLDSLRKLYIMTLYQSFVLLFLNLGCVVNFTQSFFITFFSVQQQLSVASPLSRANDLMLLPTMSSIPNFSNARSCSLIMRNLRSICQIRNLHLRGSKGKQLNLKMSKYPFTNHGSWQGSSVLRVTVAYNHLSSFTTSLGMSLVKRLTTLLKVSTPVMKSPPPMNSSTFSSSSEVNLLQSRCWSSSSIISKNPPLKNSSFENSKVSMPNFCVITSVSLSMSILWLSNWVCSNFSMSWSQAVSKRQKEGTALGKSQRMKGRESSAKGTVRMTEQGMNLIMSTLMRCVSANSYPVNSLFSFFLYRFIIQFLSCHRSFEPCTIVYFASFSRNFVFSSSVFSRSENTFVLRVSISLWSSRPYRLGVVSNLPATDLTVCLSILLSLKLPHLNIKRNQLSLIPPPLYFYNHPTHTLFHCPPALPPQPRSADGQSSAEERKGET